MRNISDYWANGQDETNASPSPSPLPVQQIKYFVPGKIGSAAHKTSVQLPQFAAR